MPKAGNGKGQVKGWTYGRPNYGGGGWVFERGMVHDRFAEKRFRRYDYYAACSDGCYMCVWQMVNAGYVNGREQARRTGFCGMDFARQAHSRGVETEALEFYLQQLGIKAKVQDLSDYGDSCDDW